MTIADLGQHIEKLRNHQGLTREQFAESTGLDIDAIEQLERGVHPGPTLHVLRRVCAALGVKLWELFEAIEEFVAAQPFGERLEQLRTRRRWDREQLANKSGLDVTAIEDIEAEKLSPDLDTLRRLARALDLELSELFE